MTPAEISERVSAIMTEASALMTDIRTRTFEIADMIISLSNDYEVPDLDDDNG